MPAKLQRIKTKGFGHSHMNYRYQLTLVLLFAFALSACSLLKPIPDDVSINLTTNTALNPDKEGRSSPVVLRIYELSSEKQFVDKDFFDIYDDEKETLGDTLIKKQEFELSPNESRKLAISPNNKTKFIGIVAAFRNLDNAKWQEIIALKSQKPTGIPVITSQNFEINLDQNKIKLLNN